VKYSSENGIRYVEMTKGEFEGLDGCANNPDAPRGGGRTPMWKVDRGLEWEMKYYVDHSPGDGEWALEVRVIQIVDEDWKGRALKAEAEVERLKRWLPGHGEPGECEHRFGNLSTHCNLCGAAGLRGEESGVWGT